MKSKMLVVLSTLVMALGLMAQNAAQTPTTPSGDNPKACACCNHDQAGGQMSKDGKDATMSHDEMMSKDSKAGMKCPMMAKDKDNDKDGKMSCCGKDGGCCKDGKCDMAKGSNGCCGGKMCERPPAG